MFKNIQTWFQKIITSPRLSWQLLQKSPAQGACNAPPAGAPWPVPSPAPWPSWAAKDRWARGLSRRWVWEPRKKQLSCGWLPCESRNFWVKIEVLKLKQRCWISCFVAKQESAKSSWMETKSSRELFCGPKLDEHQMSVFTMASAGTGTL